MSAVLRGLAVLGVVLFAGAQVAHADGGTNLPAAPTSYYLALGDSVPVWDGSNSYPYLILGHYQGELPGLQLNDIAVSGETTTSMLHDGQYEEALGFLQAHRVTLL